MGCTERHLPRIWLELETYSWKESRGLIIKGLQSCAMELTLYPEGGRVLVSLTRMSLGSDGQLVFPSLVAMRSMYGTEGGWVRTVWGKVIARIQVLKYQG